MYTLYLQLANVHIHIVLRWENAQSSTCSVKLRLCSAVTQAQLKAREQESDHGLDFVACKASAGTVRVTPSEGHVRRATVDHI